MGIVVFDLDSCLADTSPRHHLSPFVDPEQTWHSYAKACSKDLPMDTIYLLRHLYIHNRIHILTGRRSSAEQETKDWLDKHVVPHDVLRMRNDDDPESNTDYKIEYMRTLKNVSLFFSDWLPECQAVRKHLGIPSICINPEYDKGNDPTMLAWQINAPSMIDNK